jgi:GT2 family glycosyltransferase
VEPVPTLITVPARADSAEELDPLLQTLASLRATAPDAVVLVVDDRSPAPQAQMIQLAAAELDCAHIVQQDGEGRLAAYNAGLAAAREHDMDACFVASGLVLDSPGWLDRLRARTGTDGEPAAVAGGAVIDCTGTIRQAGYFFSLFRRAWSARLGRVPEILLDVDKPMLCPVDADLMLVRHAWSEAIGDFDELLDGAHASLDFCLRATDVGGQCVFEPTVRGRALTDVKGEPDDESVAGGRLRVKHANMSFEKWVPEII